MDAKTEREWAKLVEEQRRAQGWAAALLLGAAEADETYTQEELESAAEMLNQRLAPRG